MRSPEPCSKRPDAEYRLLLWPELDPWSSGFMQWTRDGVRTPRQMHRFAHRLGRHVNVALSGGRRLDDCLLVSEPANRAETVWVYTGGEDHFLPRETVIDIWESPR